MASGFLERALFSASALTSSKPKCVAQSRHDLILQLEQVGHVFLEAVGPEMGAGRRVDELGVDTHPVLIALQDQVVARLGNALGVELIKAEAERGARSKSPDAIDLTMRGWALTYQNGVRLDKDTINAARALFEQALKIDPNDADALAGEALCYVDERFFFANPGTDYDAKVIGQADRAIALAPDTVEAYWAKSIQLSFSRRFDEALRTADAGLAINPNFAPLYSARISANVSLGQF